MNIAKYPRVRLDTHITPIEFMPALTNSLHGPNLYIKRDDLLSLAGGGNKIRKLEFLLGDAISKGADVIITCGAVQSNHCRLTLAASKKLGLSCKLILEERVVGSYQVNANGNNLLYHMLGMDEPIIVPGGSDMYKEMEKLAQSLQAQGLTPYIIPTGGSNNIGDLGYLACAQEILFQSQSMGVHFDAIVCTSGSGGTHAGLLAGMKATSTDTKVVGIGINRRKELQKKAVWELATHASQMINSNATIELDDVIVFDEYIGKGYSLPTAAMKRAVFLSAQTEGLLLDPTYTGKAMSGLIDLIEKKYFNIGENILFIHTGGLPGVFAHPQYLLGMEEQE